MALDQAKINELNRVTTLNAALTAKLQRYKDLITQLQGSTVDGITSARVDTLIATLTAAINTYNANPSPSIGTARDTGTMLGEQIFELETIVEGVRLGITLTAGGNLADLRARVEAARMARPAVPPPRPAPGPTVIPAPRPATPGPTVTAPAPVLGIPDTPAIAAEKIRLFALIADLRKLVNEKIKTGNDTVLGHDDNEKTGNRRDYVVELFDKTLGDNWGKDSQLDLTQFGTNGYAQEILDGSKASIIDFLDQVEEEIKTGGLGVDIDGAKVDLKGNGSSEANKLNELHYGLMALSGAMERYQPGMIHTFFSADLPSLPDTIFGMKVPSLTNWLVDYCGWDPDWFKTGIRKTEISPEDLSFFLSAYLVFTQLYKLPAKLPSFGPFGSRWPGIRVLPSDRFSHLPFTTSAKRKAYLSGRASVIQLQQGQGATLPPAPVQGGAPAAAPANEAPVARQTRLLGEVTRDLALLEAPESAERRLLDQHTTAGDRNRTIAQLQAIRTELQVLTPAYIRTNAKRAGKALADLQIRYDAAFNGSRRWFNRGGGDNGTRGLAAAAEAGVHQRPRITLGGLEGQFLEAHRAQLTEIDARFIELQNLRNQRIDGLIAERERLEVRLAGLTGNARVGIDTRLGEINGILNGLGVTHTELFADVQARATALEGTLARLTGVADLGARPMTDFSRDGLRNWFSSSYLDHIDPRRVLRNIR